MGGVPARRMLRDLRANIGRYLALTLLIVIGVFIVFSIVGAAEVVLIGTEDKKSVNMVEDGSFTVFLPLDEADMAELEQNGTRIEEKFSLDINAEDGSLLRMFRSREDIDLIQLDCGRLAESMGEAVVEKGYAAAHGLKQGDSLSAAGRSFTVTGIGSVPDYDQMLAKLSDTAVEHESFGLIFVTDGQYSDIRDNTVQTAEEYTYSYRLGSENDSDHKERIKGLDFDYTKVEDKYFRETIDDALSRRRDIEDGVNSINNGAVELSEGLSVLTDADKELRDGADRLFREYLSQGSSALSAMGGNAELTAENYGEVLGGAAAAGSQQAAALKDSLDSIAAFRQGIREYTENAEKAAEGSAELADGTAELEENTQELLDEIFDIEIHNLTSFMTASDNIRIGGAAGDVVVDKSAGLVAGIIVLILFSYVISVFVVHQIEREQTVIGALYALGVKKKDLLIHYIAMPTLIAFLGGAIGFGLGLSPLGIKTQLASTYEYFSVPEFDIRVPVYLIVYALVLPPVISAAVNAVAINRKLSRTALSLMKNEQSAGSCKQFRLRSKSFTRVFSIRQLIRESRSAAAILLGMLISVLVLMLGLNTFTLCYAIKENNTADTRYEYMYFYKYPEKQVPEGGEGAYIKTLSTDCMGYTLDVTVIGLDGESRFFTARPEKGVSRAVINNSLNERFGYEKGDIVTFSSLAEDRAYSFTVTGICEYSPGFTIFMDIGSMRELFGEDEDYFNAVFSDRELDIDEGRLYSVTAKKDIEKSSAVFIKMMKPLMLTLISAGIVILFVVMYLMMGVMIDRSAMGISLIKIFGYRPREIRQLYLNSNLIVVAVGALAVIPLAKLIIDSIYPSFICNVACSMKLSYSWYIYLGIYALLLVIYLAARMLLVGKIKKITPAEILKNRE